MSQYRIREKQGIEKGTALPRIWQSLSAPLMVKVGKGRILLVQELADGHRGWPFRHQKKKTPEGKRSRHLIVERAARPGMPQTG